MTCQECRGLPIYRPGCDCSGHCFHAPDVVTCWRCRGTGVDPDSDDAVDSGSSVAA